MDMIDAWSAELSRARIPTVPGSLRLICHRDLLVSFLAYQVGWAVAFSRELGLDCSELEHTSYDSLDAIQQGMQAMSRLRDALQAITTPDEAAKPAATAIATASCGTAGVAAIRANFERENRRALEFWSPPLGRSKGMISKAATDAANEFLSRVPILLRSSPMLFRRAYFAATAARIGGGAKPELIAAARTAAAGCALEIAAHELAAFSWLVGFEALRTAISSRQGSSNASIESCVSWLRGRARLIGRGQVLTLSTERAGTSELTQLGSGA